MSRPHIRNARRVTGFAAIAAGVGLVLAIAGYPHLGSAFLAAAVIAAVIVIDHLLNLEDRR